MMYVLGLPPGVYVDRSICTRLMGGACQEPEVIYLYGHGSGSEGWEHRIWPSLLWHEHLHDLLYKNGVLGKFHHKIIGLMEADVYHSSRGSTNDN